MNMKQTTGQIRHNSIFLAALFFFTLGLAGCPGRTVTVLTYNVGNLFDGVDNGTEYREYDPGRGVWNDSWYRQKLARTVLAIRRATTGGPDIVFLQEIENAGVLQTLWNDGLKDQGYGYAAAYPGSKSVTTVGILSKFPLRRVAVYMVSAWKGEPLREILEASADIDGETVYLFCNHWKAKGGGKDRETERSRLEAAGILARRVREIRLADPRAAIIAAGDFNERPDEYARTGRTYQTALIPVANDPASGRFKDSLALCDDQAGSGLKDGRVVFFEPWLVYNGKPEGSIVFEKKWEAIDHILFMPGGSGFAYMSFQVVSEPDMLHPRSGYPLAWEKKSPEKGFSDHLPVLLTLEK
jgi:endonuclease/exonuclease/phosphatase family metal-dependent hydrolase